MTMRIYCSRSKDAHQVGAIDADYNGPLLTYQESVSTSPKDARAILSPQDGLYYLRRGVEREVRAPVHEILSIHIWCAGCKTDHPQSANGLFDEARKGRKSFKLQSSGGQEGLWTRR